LSVEDKPDWYAQIFNAPYLAYVSSRVSPNGRYLAFMSKRSLTGYDNTDAFSGELDEEVYEYDAQSGKLVCASCDPTGARPVGVSDDEHADLTVDHQGIWTRKEGKEGDIHYNHWLAGSVPGWDNLNNNPPTYQPRYLSDSGRLFFDSPVDLVAQDTNGLEDVYQYEPEGVGDCSSTTSSAANVFVGEVAGSPVGGCVGLISSGTSSSESAFYDASENGDDVFFDTTSKLTGEDYDKGFDIYDAHVCSTAVPCRTVPVISSACSSGDSCKAAPSPQPEIFGSAPSATFNGAGNVVPSSRGVRQKSLTVSQRLKRALRVCHKEKGKRRALCEREAHRRYPLKHARKTAKRGGRG
jgi:hypothetical protein